MTATQAREYLKTAARTETGRQAMRDLGLDAVITAPDKGDDASSITAAMAVHGRLSRRYPIA